MVAGAVSNDCGIRVSYGFWSMAQWLPVSIKARRLFVADSSDDDGPPVGANEERLLFFLRYSLGGIHVNEEE